MSMYQRSELLVYLYHQVSFVRHTNDFSFPVEQALDKLPGPHLRRRRKHPLAPP